MDITGMVQSVNSATSGLQQLIAIKMLQQAQVPEKQAAELIRQAVASDDYAFSVYA